MLRKIEEVEQELLMAMKDARTARLARDASDVLDAAGTLASLSRELASLYVSLTAETPDGDVWTEDQESPHHREAAPWDPDGDPHGA